MIATTVPERQPPRDGNPARRGRPGRLETAVVATVLMVAACGAALVHRQIPWISAVYLGALLSGPAALWWLVRWANWPRRWSRLAVALVTIAIVALLPVPWMRVPPDRAPGTAWRLDGRLVIDGVVIDPPGAWYWLTAGRPPIVAELVRGWLVDDEVAMSMLDGRRASRPAVVEPAAAAAGLRRAGWPVSMGLTVEVSDPVSDHLPKRAVVDTLNGHIVSTRASWDAATAALSERNRFTDAHGLTYEFAGNQLPYRRADLIDTPRGAFEVAIGGRLARTVPGSWMRQLSLGSSHGLIVALVSYAYASGDDLAAGRTIAATGKIRGDGSVGSIGGLEAKAAAARDIGADVLVFPAAQHALLQGFDPGAMQLCPVSSLNEAIDALTRSATGDAC